MNGTEQAGSSAHCVKASPPAVAEEGPAANPPAGDGWLHEIKHDVFRMLVRRDAGVERVSWGADGRTISMSTLSWKRRAAAAQRAPSVLSRRLRRRPILTA